MNTQVINATTILVDLSKSRANPTTQSNKVREIANHRFFGSKTGIVRDNAGEGGFFLGGNTVNVYHVASIKKGLWIASKEHLTSSDTRPIAEAYLKSMRK